LIENQQYIRMNRRGDRGPPNTDGMISLKVDNLTYRTTPDMLKRVFEKYGDVGDVYIPRDPYTQESRGFAFVRYFDERDADDAIDRLNGTLLDGRELRVQLAKHARPPMTRRAGYSSSSSHRKSGRR
jgi:splicing factor, arginine/serine-rich 2